MNLAQTNKLLAIAEHQRQSEHLRAIQSHYNATQAENEMLRRELSGLRMENSQLMGELNRQSAPPPAHISQPSYSSDHYASAPRTELPPLRSLNNGIQNGPDSMTGVQYEAPRPNGYRPERY